MLHRLSRLRTVTVNLVRIIWEFGWKKDRTVRTDDGERPLFITVSYANLIIISLDNQIIVELN